MGKKPAPFDILVWNADRTNLPAALHAQFLEMFATNVLAQRRGMTVLGSPVDLSQIKVDAYVTGGTTDHLTPWKGCYRSAQLLGGDSTFVLANTGHIQTLICPPNNPKARYWVGGEPGPDPDAWKAGAEERTPERGGALGGVGSSRGPGPRNRHRPSWATPPIRCWAARRAPTCTCRPDLAMPMALGPHQLGSQQIRRPHKPATHKPAPSGWDPRHPVVTGGAACPANRDRDLPPLAINTFCTVTLRVLSIACTAGPGCWIKPIRRRQVRCEHKEAGG